MRADRETKYLAKGIAYYRDDEDKPWRKEGHLVGYTKTHYISIIQVNDQWHSVKCELLNTGAFEATYDHTWEVLTEEQFAVFLDQAMRACFPNFKIPFEWTIIHQHEGTPAPYVPSSGYSQTCAICQKEFQSARPAKTCSPACRVKASRLAAKQSVTDGGTNG
ncbi:MAG TPA: hypothetical protein VHS96_09935 [Bacteroidia bacterium]|nr:hypothetical protein [Bacteroidia bacterium]